jgi:hypothetical protein
LTNLAVFRALLLKKDLDKFKFLGGTMKKLSVLLMIIAVLLSDWMCAVVAYNYRGMEEAAKYGFSAPPDSVVID